MTYYPRTIISAIKIVGSDKGMRLLFLPIAAIFFAIFIAIPTLSIPSNTLAFQLSLITSVDYITLSILSLLSSLFILVNIQTYKMVKERNIQMAVLVQGSTGSTAGVLASIFGVASCPMCVASLFGFLGFGVVGFLARNQWWVFTIALVIMLISLHFISRKLIRVCEKC